MDDHNDDDGAATATAAAADDDMAQNARMRMNRYTAIDTDTGRYRYRQRYIQSDAYICCQRNVDYRYRAGATAGSRQIAIYTTYKQQRQQQQRRRRRRRRQVPAQLQLPASDTDTDTFAANRYNVGPHSRLALSRFDASAAIARLRLRGVGVAAA